MSRRLSVGAFVCPSSSRTIGTKRYLLGLAASISFLDSDMAGHEPLLVHNRAALRGWYRGQHWTYRWLLVVRRFVAKVLSPPTSLWRFGVSFFLSFFVCSSYEVCSSSSKSEAFSDKVLVLAQQTLSFE